MTSSHTLTLLTLLSSLAIACGGDDRPICGNAVREGTESCDLGYSGNGIAGSNCSSSCTYQSTTSTTTTSTCCRSTTTGLSGYCTQVCTNGIVGSGCTADTSNSCLTNSSTGTGSCCISNTTRQSGYCSQICTGGVVGNGCTADTSNACVLGAGTSNQCCSNQVTQQVGKCSTICPPTQLCYIIPGVCL